MKKTYLVLIVISILVAGLLSFKIMSFLGCYIQIADIVKCWKLTAW